MLARNPSTVVSVAMAQSLLQLCICLQILGKRDMSWGGRGHIKSCCNCTSSLLQHRNGKGVVWIYRHCHHFIVDKAIRVVL